MSEGEIFGTGEHVTDLFIAWADQQYRNLTGNLVNDLEAAYRAGYADAHTEMRQASGDRN
jgi:hypothetical protein